MKKMIKNWRRRQRIKRLKSLRKRGEFCGSLSIDLGRTGSSGLALALNQVPELQGEEGRAFRFGFNQSQNRSRPDPSGLL